MKTGWHGNELNAMIRLPLPRCFIKLLFNDTGSYFLKYIETMIKQSL